jgi:hypothetical protein
LRDIQFGAVTVRAADARINPRQRADFLPQPEPLGPRFDGGLDAQDGLLFGGDKLEADLGRAFGNQRHVHWTPRRRRALTTRLQKTSPAGAAFNAMANVSG